MAGTPQHWHSSGFWTKNRLPDRTSSGSLWRSMLLQNSSLTAIKEQQEKSHFSLYFQDAAETKLLNRVPDICKRLNHSTHTPCAASAMNKGHWWQQEAEIGLFSLERLEYICRLTSSRVHYLTGIFWPLTNHFSSQDRTAISKPTLLLLQWADLLRNPLELSLLSELNFPTHCWWLWRKKFPTHHRGFPLDTGRA